MPHIAPTNGSGKGVPFTSGAVVGNALPLTASTAGLVCNDHPVTVQWPAEVTGVAFSPGFLTFAGGPIAAGPGIVTLRCHAKSAVISGITGPTNINVATQVVAGANAQTDFPLLVQRPAPDDDKVDLFYKNGRPAHDIQGHCDGNWTNHSRVYWRDGRIRCAIAVECSQRSRERGGQAGVGDVL